MKNNPYQNIHIGQHKKKWVDHTNQAPGPQFILSLLIMFRSVKHRYHIVITAIHKENTSHTLCKHRNHSHSQRAYVTHMIAWIMLWCNHHIQEFTLNSQMHLKKVINKLAFSLNYGWIPRCLFQVKESY